MLQILTTLLLFAVGGTAALLANRKDRSAVRFGYFSCIAACICGLFGAVPLIFGTQGETQCVIQTVSFSFDRLSALFLLPVYTVGILAATHAVGYLEGHADGRQGYFWFLKIAWLPV